MFLLEGCPYPWAWFFPLLFVMELQSPLPSQTSFSNIDNLLTSVSSLFCLPLWTLLFGLHENPFLFGLSDPGFSVASFCFYVITSHDSCESLWFLEGVTIHNIQISFGCLVSLFPVVSYLITLSLLHPLYTTASVAFLKDFKILLNTS